MPAIRGNLERSKCRRGLRPLPSLRRGCAPHVRDGLKAYRFSFSWSRILPEGVGPINPAGLDFYDRLVDALLAAGIQPFATLYHWDLPLALFHRGGWLNRDSADWFAEYTGVVADRLGDRIRHWMTFNEPQMFIGLGLVAGVHAPGLRLPDREVLRALHHVNLAHGRAVQTLRARAKAPATIGVAPMAFVKMPAQPDDPASVDLARNYMFSVNDRGHFNNTLVLRSAAERNLSGRRVGAFRRGCTPSLPPAT